MNPSLAGDEPKGGWNVVAGKVYDAMRFILKPWAIPDTVALRAAGAAMDEIRKYFLEVNSNATIPTEGKDQRNV